jgi:hypothetical protein
LIGQTQLTAPNERDGYCDFKGCGRQTRPLDQFAVSGPSGDIVPRLDASGLVHAPANMAADTAKMQITRFIKLASQLGFWCPLSAV